MATVAADAQVLDRALIHEVTWGEVLSRLERYDRPGTTVYGVPRGGMIAAGFLSKASNTWDPKVADLILDDVIDSGSTRNAWAARCPGKPFMGLFDKLGADSGLGWIRFPWEPTAGTEAIDHVRRFLQTTQGAKLVSRETFLRTPERYVAAMGEMLGGYAIDPSLILATAFESSSDEIVICRGIRFTSVCEHHMLPFIGSADVAYLPGGSVIGLSKLARLVDVFARRLQIQERMTEQITTAIMEHTHARGAAAIVRAKHCCLGCRGARQPDAEMVTSSLLGVFRTNLEARAEFLHLCS